MRIGVDEHADCAALLGEINFYAAEVGAVAADDDFAVDVDVLRGERIEIFKAAVVGVDDLAGDIAGAGRAVEWHDDARVVLLRIAPFFCDVLARGAGHERMAGFVPGFNVDDFGVVEEHAIGNDFGVEAGGAEFARDELGGFVVFRRCGQDAARR